MPWILPKGMLPPTGLPPQKTHPKWMKLLNAMIWDATSGEAALSSRKNFPRKMQANNVYEKLDILSHNNQLWLLVEDSESLEAPVAGNANWREITFAGTWNSSGNDAGTIVWDSNGTDAGTIVAHSNNFFMLVEDTGGNIPPEAEKPEWAIVENELISRLINLRGDTTIEQLITS